jgi:hypothetical protein
MTHVDVARTARSAESAVLPTLLFEKSGRVEMNLDSAGGAACATSDSGRHGAAVYFAFTDLYAAMN